MKLLLLLTLPLVASQSTKKLKPNDSKVEFETQWQLVTHEIKAKKNQNNICPRCNGLKNSIECILLH